MNLLSSLPQVRLGYDKDFTVFDNYSSAKRLISGLWQYAMTSALCTLFQVYDNDFRDVRIISGLW